MEDLCQFNLSVFSGAILCKLVHSRKMKLANLSHYVKKLKTKKGKKFLEVLIPFSPV